MTRILWHSVAPWAQTGYGQQTALFAPKIRYAGHDIAISAWYGVGGAAIEYRGIRVYPAQDNKYGNLLMPIFAAHHKAELVFALMDAWPLNPHVMKHLPLAVWCPVDHKPTPPKVVEFFKASGARAVAMSKFGEAELTAEGLDPLYIPHGIDTNTFHPEGRDEWREAAGVKDRFVVGVVANNSGGVVPSPSPPRKAFPQILMAFSAFHRKHPDSVLYLHTGLDGRLQTGLNLFKLIERFEVPEAAIRVTDQTQMEIGISPAEMAGKYRAFDVLLNPSYGEGFGIPIVEAQACGTPVIVTDWTSMTELCGAGWRIQGEEWYDTNQDAFYMCPPVGMILEALEDAYENAGKLRAQAREFAVEYNADRVYAEHFAPALEVLCKPREVPPLVPLNRAQRRTKRKPPPPPVALEPGTELRGAA